MSATTDSVKCDIRIPKRVLHFSDGVLEEYENEDTSADVNHSNAIQSDKQIVLKSWPMISVVVNTVVWFGSQTLKACDYLGENLANFFGITSPKYEYEIEEYNRRIEEQIRRESMIKSEFEGWNKSDAIQKEIRFSDVKSVNNLKDINLNDDQKGVTSPTASKA